MQITMIRWGIVSLVALLAWACNGGTTTNQPAPSSVSDAGVDSAVWEGGIIPPPAPDAGPVNPCSPDVEARCLNCAQYQNVCPYDGPLCGGAQICADGDQKCMVEALRDGTTGWFGWGSVSGAEGENMESYRLEIVPGRHALLDHHEQLDLVSNHWWSVGQPLQDPSYFADCLTKTPPDYSGCIYNATKASECH
jgi:hypothetical protein